MDGEFLREMKFLRPMTQNQKSWGVLCDVLSGAQHEMSVLDLSNFEVVQRDGSMRNFGQTLQNTELALDARTMLLEVLA